MAVNRQVAGRGDYGGVESMKMSNRRNGLPMEAKSMFVESIEKENPYTQMSTRQLIPLVKGLFQHSR